MAKIKSILFQFIPIIAIWLLLAYPYKALTFNTSVLGKIILMLVVLFYAYMDKYYGAIVVALIILYYKFIDGLVKEGFAENLPSQLRKQFESQYCKNGQLFLKNVNVKLDQVQHVFPEVSYTGQPCNPCDEKCDYNIIEMRLKAETDLMLPKSSNPPPPATTAPTPPPLPPSPPISPVPPTPAP